jgi:hypothetical protein
MQMGRMAETQECQWTTADLIGYLVSVKATLTTEEMTQLKVTPAFSREDADLLQTNDKIQRFQARQLYEPVDTLRQMKLPIIDWSKQKKWRSSSKEGNHSELLAPYRAQYVLANFLFDIGLRRHPPLDDLVLLCSSSASEVYSRFLHYSISPLNRF